MNYLIAASVPIKTSSYYSLFFILSWSLFCLFQNHYVDGFVLQHTNHFRNQRINHVQQQQQKQNQQSSPSSQRRKIFPFYCYDVSSSSSSLYLAKTTSSNDDVVDRSSNRLQNFKVGIVGGGPSGLLVGHGLVQHGAEVHIYEKRNRPQELELEQRAYALGLGLRGRTAIQAIDSYYYQNYDNSATKSLWDAITIRGCPSERFILHIGPLSLRLRDESDSFISENKKLEPSLLLFQSDLCRSFMDELENRWLSSNRITTRFNCEITKLDIKSKTISYCNEDGTIEKEQYDLIVGCDGVNSIVRQNMVETWSPIFEAKQEPLPGYLKVARLTNMPSSQLDPTAVQLLFPRKGTVTCFVEPTANSNCCLLFAGGRSTTTSGSSDSNTTKTIDDILLKSYDIDNMSRDQYDVALKNVTIELQERFPKLVGDHLDIIAKQLMEQEPTQASKVQCNNIFHGDHHAVLIGDAAHATGGVSGQGVNSALQDCVNFLECLLQYYDANQKNNSMRHSLLQYSKKAVPEAKALYDLSFGPIIQKPLIRIRYVIKNIIDTLFKGKYGIGERPLNTLLTTSEQSFANIRRQRQPYYNTAIFPTQEEWDDTIETLHHQMIDYTNK